MTPAEGGVDRRVGHVDQAVPLSLSEDTLDGAVEVAGGRVVAEHLFELLVGQRVHANSPLSF